MSKQVLPITRLIVGDVSADVLVCGDPGRADKIAARLQDAVLLSDHREYRAYRGTYQGYPVSVCSHGIGAPGAAIAFEELIAAGARRLIRLGTCGSLQPDIQSGDLVIAAAAVQHTGYGREMVPSGYPAVADPELSLALSHAAAHLGFPNRKGLVLTRDVFYQGVDGGQLPDYQSLSAANVLAVEMECAALFIVGSLRAVSTAAILAVDGNVLESAESFDSYMPHEEKVMAAVNAEIAIALTALTGAPLYPCSDD